MKTRIGVVCMAALALLLGCAGTGERGTSGIFLGDWFDHYQRGLERMDQLDYAGAESDFRQALAVVDQDTHHKRTYGVHHIPYYPNRELGIALLKQARAEEAEERLLDSMASVDTGKARYYLNEARRARLAASGEDSSAPTITLSRPSEDTEFSAFRVTVSGEAKDDQFVAGVSINGEGLPIELAKPKVSFEEEIELAEGENEIVVEAVDLLGKKSRQVWTMTSDRSAPTLTIHEKRLISGRAEVSGSVYDDVGIKEIVLGDRMLFEGDAKSREFDATLDLQAGKTSLPFRLTDRAGNVTSGKIEFEATKLGFLPGRPLRVASVGVDSILVAAIDDNEPPSIRIDDFEEKQDCYLDRIYLGGAVSDQTNLRKATLSHTFDGEPVFANRSILPEEATELYWSRFIDLAKPGTHVITISVEDAAGNQSERTLVFERRIPTNRSIGSRLSMSLLPFESHGRAEFSPVAFDLVESAFLAERRFKMLERSRIDEILAEHEIAVSKLADPKQAVRAGRLLTADLSLFGAVVEKKDSIHILCRVVDVETSEVLGRFDVYNEEKTLAALSDMAEGLYLKVAHRFPLIEGTVIDKSGEVFYVDKGKESRLWEGARVLIFREGAEIKTPTGVVLGRKVEEVCSGYLKNLEDAYSMGAAYDEDGFAKITAEDRVITR